MKRAVMAGCFVGAMAAVLLGAARTAAQTVAPRYGPGPCEAYVAPRGTYKYPSGVDESSLGISVDPAFQAQMKKTRLLGELPAAPIYDLVVEATPTWGTCYTQAPERFSAALPKQLPFSVFLELQGERIVGPGVLSDSGRKTADGEFIYEWKVKGWPSGIVSGDKLEKLIVAVEKGDPSLKIVAEIKKPDGEKERREGKANFSLCAPLWGNGNKTVVFERGESARFSPSALVANAENVRLNGFEVVDPFKKYKNQFSHFVDLGNHNDGGMLDRIEGSSNPSAVLGDFAYNCGNSSVVIFYSGIRALLDGTEINGIAGYGTGAVVVRPAVSPYTVIHELGHALADLSDEAGTDATSPVALPEKNCSFRPSTDFTYGGKKYADGEYVNVSGCDHFKRMGSRIIFRPSVSSLMNYGERDNRFNVVSCGYLVAAIKGGTGPEYWPECVGLDTVKPKNTAQGPSRNGLALLAELFPGAPSGVEVASGSRLIFENDAAGKGVVWREGEPMPAVLEFRPQEGMGSEALPARSELKKSTGEPVSISGPLQATPTLVPQEIRDALRSRIQSLTARLQSLRAAIEVLKRAEH